jgi:F420-dependent oxidoreductase-like protein
MALKIGMHTGQQNIEMDELRRLWRFADDNAFDFLSIWDHFYEAPPIDGNSPAFEAIACMAAMAAETSNVRIGCHVMCVNYRNPGLLANSVITLDHLSHGRIELGLGAGWHVPEHEAYGYEYSSAKVRSDRLEEGIQALRLLFTEDVADFEGEHYRLNGAKLYPRPVQERLPLVVGGRGERRTLRTAARYADGWNVPYINTEEFERLLGVLDEWCEREDRDPAELERSINLHMHMGANAADAERISRERGAIGGAVSGTSQQAIETLKHYEEAGAARVSIAIRPPVEWDALHAFVEEVIPAFR